MRCLLFVLNCCSLLVVGYFVVCRRLVFVVFDWRLLVVVVWCLLFGVCVLLCCCCLLFAVVWCFCVCCSVFGVLLCVVCCVLYGVWCLFFDVVS